jgi:protein gp37
MFNKIDKGQWWDVGIKLIQGCTPVSEGCKNCWSLAMEHRFKQGKGVTFHLDRFAKKVKTKKPTAFAIWNDLFHEAIQFHQIDAILAMMNGLQRHVFMVLTKRPRRALQYFEWVGQKIKNAGLDSIPSQSDNLLDYVGELPNLWLGTTIEKQNNINRIYDLLKCPARIHFVSCEPLLSNIELPLYDLQYCSNCNAIVNTYIDGAGEEYIGNACCNCDSYTKSRNIDWVIAGCESGHKRREMNIAWPIILKNQCEQAGVPFFFKQMYNGNKLIKLPTIDGIVYNQFPV